MKHNHVLENKSIPIVASLSMRMNAMHAYICMFCLALNNDDSTLRYEGIKMNIEKEKNL